jgi:long-chain acyl-CoA synthetase
MSEGQEGLANGGERAGDISRPWTALYTGAPMEGDYQAGTLPDQFSRAAARDRDAPAIHYFDARLTFNELDQMSDAFAHDLKENGFEAGDRLGLFMQNLPQFVIAALACWKQGGIVVPISPMNRARELDKLLTDCLPLVIVAQDDLLKHVRDAASAIAGYEPRLIATSPYALQSRNDARVLPPIGSGDGGPELLDIIAVATGRKPLVVPAITPHSPALLVYTSGTTGVPKGAVISHANVTHNGEAVVRWYRMAPGMGPVALMAPLFHVSGLVHISIAWAMGAPLILSYRFHPDVIIEAITEHRPAFMVGAITAFIALMNAEKFTSDSFSSFQVLLSGGAPVPPAVVASFETMTGRYIHNGYGLTETTAGVVAVPFETRAPVDETSGTLSIGVPKYGVDLWIAGDDGKPLGFGKIGEIVVAGAAVSKGYWNKPEETADAMRSDGFRTGDVGFMDDAGWVYLVDRKKDMIVASGYKVWPREVEDVLYMHRAIREAAVTGVADTYRGETVRAIVSFKAGEAIDSDELIQWCRDRLAPYKVPREVVVMDDLPKTPSGKILRRELKG